MSVFGVLANQDVQFRSFPAQGFDFVVADQAQPFTNVLRKVDDLLGSRKMLRELAVAASGAFGLFCFS